MKRKEKNTKHDQRSQTGRSELAKQAHSNLSDQINSGGTEASSKQMEIKIQTKTREEEEEEEEVT